jgi:uncharacterized protein YndB with AHSA1/START domain
MAKTTITAEPGTPFIDITREFDAPRDLVVRAFTDAELIPQWWGPSRYTTTVERLEARDGGRWRFRQADDDGNEFAFHGVFHGSPSVDGITQTFEYEGMPGHISLETALFEDVGGGKTLVRQHSAFQSVADRDGMVEAGMEDGVVEGNERLDQLFRRLSAVGSR